MGPRGHGGGDGLRALAISSGDYARFGLARLGEARHGQSWPGYGRLGQAFASPGLAWLVVAEGFGQAWLGAPVPPLISSDLRQALCVSLSVRTAKIPEEETRSALRRECQLYNIPAHSRTRLQLLIAVRAARGTGHGRAAGYLSYQKTSVVGRTLG